MRRDRQKGWGREGGGGGGGALVTSRDGLI